MKESIKDETDNNNVNRMIEVSLLSHSIINPSSRGRDPKRNIAEEYIRILPMEPHHRTLFSVLFALFEPLPQFD